MLSRREWSSQMNQIFESLEKLRDEAPDRVEKRLMGEAHRLLTACVEHRGYPIIDIEEYEAARKKLGPPKLKVIKSPPVDRG